MPDVHVTAPDPFHAAIAETIAQALPDRWTFAQAVDSTPEARLAALAPADIAFVMGGALRADHLAAAPRLRFIQKLGAGTDNIDLDFCREAGIRVARLSAGNAIPVAEHTVMMILAATRRLISLDARTRNGHWDKEAARGVNRHLHGKTVGIIGFGAIGRRVAGLLTGFGVETIYNDIVRAPTRLEEELRASPVDLEDLLQRSDVVTLHVPLAPDTRGMINDARIAAMKPGAVLVNCARGGLVDEAALADALQTGRLFAAGLDVFTPEPPPPGPLFELPNTVVTPHCAGATLDNFAAITARAIANAEAHLAGRPLPEADIVVDPPVGA